VNGWNQGLPRAFSVSLLRRGWRSQRKQPSRRNTASQRLQSWFARAAFDPCRDPRVGTGIVPTPGAQNRYSARCGRQMPIKLIGIPIRRSRVRLLCDVRARCVIDPGPEDLIPAWFALPAPGLDAGQREVDALADSRGTPLRYLFLMRHARHREGRLTEEGSAHVRSLAARFSEWVLAEWRDQPERTVRLWVTSASAEVQGTAAALARDVLSHVREGQGHDEPYPFGSPPKGERRAGPSGANRQPWMPRLVPSPPGHDAGKVLSAYSPDGDAFRNLYEWLQASGTGEDAARRTEADAPLLVGNDPLIGWLASKLTQHGTPVARGELVCLVSDRRAPARWRLLWTLSDDGEAEAEAVRAKVKSKMNTAGAFGTVIVGLTTFLLQNSVKTGPDAWQWLAFAALAGSASH